MTLQQYRMLKAAWVVFCTALIGVPAFLLNWQIGLLAGGLAALAVGAMTYSPDAKSNMWSGGSIANEDDDSSGSSWLISDETFDDPGWSSVTGNVWHD